MLLMYIFILLSFSLLKRSRMYFWTLTPWVWVSHLQVETVILIPIHTYRPKSHTLMKDLSYYILQASLMCFRKNVNWTNKKLLYTSPNSLIFKRKVWLLCLWWITYYNWGHKLCKMPFQTFEISLEIFFEN